MRREMSIALTCRVRVRAASRETDIARLEHAETSRALWQLNVGLV